MSDFFDAAGMVPAKISAPRIERILETGGSAMRFDGKCSRMLVHSPFLHRPLKKLPWPLSKLQPHVCEYVVYSGNFLDASWSISSAQVIHKAQFPLGDRRQFIRSFLEGAEENEVIFINAH